MVCQEFTIIKKIDTHLLLFQEKNGKVKEYPLPNVTKEDKCLEYGISAQDGKFSPIVFLKKRDKYLIRKYEI